jgi:hypothetical protein
MPQFRGQALQDKFALSILKNKRNGTFIDIGSHEPIHINNTYILEAEYGWKGIMIDYFDHFLPGYKKHRPESVHVITDATTLDYTRLMDETEMPENIDYLSLDLDGDATIKTLRKLDKEVLHRHKFAVVTFEHDVYAGSEKFNEREESREIFKRHGYVCVFDDVHDKSPNVVYEDWYIHPDLVDMEYVNNLKKRNADRYVENTFTGKSIDWRSISYEDDIKFTYCIRDRGETDGLIRFLNKMKDPDDTIVTITGDEIPKMEGDYIFYLNSNEMPTETMIKSLKTVIMEKNCDAFYVPRINIHLGITEEDMHLDKTLAMNEVGWINWPDFQGRIYKNNGRIFMKDDKLIGSENAVGFGSDPKLALVCIHHA